VHALGEALVGHVEAAELAEGTAGPPTLCHGDASLKNVFSSPNGEIAFVDWEDVRCGAGVADLAWLLVSSVAPTEWDDVIDAYGPSPRLSEVLPAAAAQGVLSFAYVDDGTSDAAGWVDRLAATSRRLAAG
jgi:aminoglycoside phosphotransferase (APT) family kinase protein